DLTHRKLLPAIANLAKRRTLPENFVVVGVARTEMSDDQFRDLCKECDFANNPDWSATVKGFRYLTGNYDDDATFAKLATLLDEIDASYATKGNRLYYLATVPRSEEH